MDPDENAYFRSNDDGYGHGYWQYVAENDPDSDCLYIFNGNKWVSAWHRLLHTARGNTRLIQRIVPIRASAEINTIITEVDQSYTPNTAHISFHGLH